MPDSAITALDAGASRGSDSATTAARLEAEYPDARARVTVAAISTYLPARRASGVAPVAALGDD